MNEREAAIRAQIGRVRESLDELEQLFARHTVRGEYVYFIQAGDTGPVKIGRAHEPGKRLAQLQVFHYEELAIRLFLPGDLTLERAAHRAFDALRLRGEWFAPGRALLDFIDARNAALSPRPLKPTAIERMASMPMETWAVGGCS